MASDSSTHAPLSPDAPARVPARPGGIEARRHRRARAHWAARLVTASGGVVPGVVCDVSEGGAGLLSSVNVPVGSLVDIAFALTYRSGDTPHTMTVLCKVRVVFCAFVGEQSRLGVQFLTLQMAERLAIRRYVIDRS